jgi:hypothetical protein
MNTMDWSLLIGIAKGLGTGLVAAMVGYMKNVPEGAQFDWKKAMPTFIIGAAAGAVSWYMAVDLDSATVLLAQFGVVAFINNVWSGLFKVYKARMP